MSPSFFHIFYYSWLDWTGTKEWRKIRMNKSIRLTGKVWEIRAQLRVWAKSPLTLAQFLERNIKKETHLRLIK